MHIRRYCLLQAIEAKVRGEDGLWFALRGKQQEFAGTALPANTPGYALLVAAGYTCVEDIWTAAFFNNPLLSPENRAAAIAALANELIKVAGLNRREADAALAAIGS